MGPEATVARERLTERELQILDYLEQVQGLDVPLSCLVQKFHRCQDRVVSPSFLLEQGCDKG
jgi:hypothetical protein